MNELSCQQTIGCNDSLASAGQNDGGLGDFEYETETHPARLRLTFLVGLI